MNVAELDDTRPHRSRKNTRKWCRGKVGTEHVFKRLPWSERPNGLSLPLGLMDEWWAVDLCQSCGKQKLIETKQRLAG